MMLLMGSTALVHSGINIREPKDLDYITTQESLDNFKMENQDRIVHVKEKRFGEVVFMQGSKPVEFEIAKPGTSGMMLLELAKEHRELSAYDWEENMPIRVATPQVVLALKMSHRYLKDSPHFRKCMDDIHLLRAKGYKIPEILAGEWMKLRQKETYWYKHPSLAQNKKEFFSDDGVGYIYDHDSIHEAVKHLSAPAFELIKEDKAEVFTSKEKFFSLPREIQLLTVLEESYVLALERSQIPNDFKPTPEASFNKALEKVCTSIASGWWREFAWENYHDVRSMYNENYVEMFKLALAEGRIRDYETNRPVLQTA